MHSIKKFASIAGALCAAVFVFAQRAPTEPAELNLLRRAYPNVRFAASYDSRVGDWRVAMTRQGSAEQVTLYWADGKMLPESELAEKESYWRLFYPYAKEIPDPANFDREEVARIQNFSSTENRSRQTGSSLYFFNAIYDADTRASTESHIKSVSFLGKTTNAHEFIFEPLARVEARIRALARTDAEVQNFIDQLSRVDSYNWREIGDRNSRSFHSYGIAVDILPRGWGSKNIYWAWRRDIDPDGWMTLPLDQRWMPPLKVIEAFEAEGFIWGGKWIIWDNMHFEYKPEIIAYTQSLGN